MAALDNLPLRNSTLKATLRRESTQDAGTLENAQQIASLIFDDAVKAAKLSNQDIGHRLQVNESIVGRWRNPNAREFPSLLQLQRLGPDFLLKLNHASNQRNGLGRRVLQSLLDVVGDLAVAVGDGR